MHKVVSMGAALLGLSLVAACVGPQGRSAEPVTTFTLEASFPAKAAPAGAPTLLVAAPQARPGFDTERMAYVRSPNQLEYYARHRWIDAPARMLAPLTVQALESTGAFAAVVQAPTVARAKWRLETEIVRLQQDFLTQPSRVRLVLRVQLIEVASQRPLAAREFATTVVAASDDARGGAQAANQAVSQLLPQLAQWCAASLGSAAPRS
jgi:cholesterol transport system auxiliary component